MVKLLIYFIKNNIIFNFNKDYFKAFIKLK